MKLTRQRRGAKSFLKKKKKLHQKDEDNLVEWWSYLDKNTIFLSVKFLEKNEERVREKEGGEERLAVVCFKARRDVPRKQTIQQDKKKQGNMTW